MFFSSRIFGLSSTPPFGPGPLPLRPTSYVLAIRPGTLVLTLHPQQNWLSSSETVFRNRLSLQRLLPLSLINHFRVGESRVNNLDFCPVDEPFLNTFRPRHPHLWGGVHYGSDNLSSFLYVEFDELLRRWKGLRSSHPSFLDPVLEFCFVSFWVFLPDPVSGPCSFLLCHLL